MKSQSFFLGDNMKTKMTFIILFFIVLVELAVANSYLDDFREKELHDTQLPTDCVQQANLIKITDAVYYTYSDINEELLTLKLAGINTECVATAKFCLREAANHFVQNIFLESDDHYIYYCKNDYDDEALIWIKHRDVYYLLNLLLLYNQFAFVEGNSVLFEPYLERYRHLETKDSQKILVNKLGESD